MATRAKILILDDDPDILDIYQEILSRLPTPLEIKTTSSGQEAISLLENEPFALLLTDLNMPQMDGFQVLAIVCRRFPSLRTVVMSGDTDADLRARCYRIGVDLYIEKPKTGREITFFVECIESLLERENQGGFRGVQSKTLLDIIQMECLTQNTVMLKLTNMVGEGRIWIEKGRIVDATVNDLNAKDAMVEMLRWKTGNFEVLPFGQPRPRTIFLNYENLLMESAQTMDETTTDLPPPPKIEQESLLASFMKYPGVQFSLAVATGADLQYDHCGADEPAALSVWLDSATSSFKTLGEKLGCGEMQSIEVICPQRYISLLSSDNEILVIGFTRTLGVQQIQETMKQIEIKWVS